MTCLKKGRLKVITKGEDFGEPRLRSPWLNFSFLVGGQTRFSHNFTFIITIQ